MGFFGYDTGVKFRKTGREIKVAIGERLAELCRRLTKRNVELEAVMDNRPLLRSYLVRERQNDSYTYAESSQLQNEMPTEDHRRVSELCIRIRKIEDEIAQLTIIQENVSDDQESELSFEDLTRLGFGAEHVESNR